MSAAWNIVLEREIPGLARSVNGSALSKVGDMLDSSAENRGVLRLMDFFSAASGEIAGFAEGHGLTLKQSFHEEWLAALDGLRTVIALIEEAEKRQLGDRVIGELQAFQEILEAATRNSVRWHLAVDF